MEIVALNFFKGKILIVSTGYYSDELFQISNLIKKNNKKIKSVTKVNWKSLNKIKENMIGSGPAQLKPVVV